MGVKLNLKIKKYTREKNFDIKVEGQTLKPINCPTKYNSGAIDEFINFLIAAKANGIFILKYWELDKRKPET